VKPNQEVQTVATSATASASFGISRADEAHIMGILRSTLYSDKILAVLREYGANAWDAHRSVGRGDVPIEVTLPTYDAPVLRIRDRGPGLSRNEVFTVYTQYGASSKRDDDNAVGMLGIGSKSGFSYASSFTITSWHAGTKAIYVAALDPSNRGLINLIHEQCLCCERPVGTKKDEADETVYCECTARLAPETGIEIQIVVKPADVDKFEERAERLYVHFEPRPTINIQLPPPPEGGLTNEHGTIRPGGHGDWVAVMGCVPYRIRLGELDLCAEHQCLHNLSGIIRFGIGDVQIAASREDLDYTDATRAAITAKFTELVDAFVTQSVAELEAMSLWDRRLRAQVLSNLGITLPAEYGEIAKGWVKLFEPSDDGVPFRMWHVSEQTSQIQVEPDTRIYIDDTGKLLKGYARSMERHYYVVRAKTRGMSYDDLKAVVDEHINACLVTGIPIHRLSELHWDSTASSRGGRSWGADKSKHKASMFVLDPEAQFKHPFSNAWSTVTRVPEDTDVFVILENFKPNGVDSFFLEYRDDRVLAEAFGVEMPQVYGYKSTTKKTVRPSDCKGLTYDAWRKQFIKDLGTPERLAEISEMWWGHVLRYTADRYDRKFLREQLGRDHAVVRLVSRCAHADSMKNRDALLALATRLGIAKDTSAAHAALEEILNRYPLLRCSDYGVRSLWLNYTRNHRNEWCKYVRLVDESLNRTQTVDTKKGTATDAADSVQPV
jgi:hypothetical protein